MNYKSYYIAIILSLVFAAGAKSQESIFTALKSDLKRADIYFQDGKFPQALEFYQAHQKKDKDNGEVMLKIARTCAKLKDHEQTVFWYRQSESRNIVLSALDNFAYAEALSSMGEYEAAISIYKKYLKQNPQDKWVLKKIWRLNNMEYLYEDSTYYSVEPLNINSNYAEFGPSLFGEGLVFVSNRKVYSAIAKVNASNNAPFQTLYYSKFKIDTLGKKFNHLLEVPKLFSTGLNSKFHQGICAFFLEGKRMIYTKSSEVKTKQSRSVLQLHIAEKVGDVWEDVAPFPYNNPEYDICHPSLSADGKTLYFSSDMPGGFGGKDLYKSELVDGKWMKPQNLGEVINTHGDESFPFSHQSGMFYFASTGHAGLGGLDIFSVKYEENEIGDIRNVGYPVNTPFDDFGIVLDEEGNSGFLSSNRKNGKFDDDLFAIKIDLQTYPLTISGTLKYKSVQWKESAKLEVLAGAKLFLIDNNKNEIVFRTTTNVNGQFDLDIPYSSKYRIKVVEKSIGEKLVSLEIPKNKKLHVNHQIVIVRDQFKESN